MKMLIKLMPCAFLILLFHTLTAASLSEQFEKVGYVEMCDEKHGTETYNTLYACFDELIDFLQANPVWTQKLFIAKERFLRTKERKYYSTDIFGFRDESKKEGRCQISFYYSIHFHEFISCRYPDIAQIPEIMRFLEICRDIQSPYGSIFQEAAVELGIESIFASAYGKPPILFKVIKYLPSYIPSKPHYDGTAFSLFLDSTDNQSLLLSTYKSSLAVEDFVPASRKFSRDNHHHSILLIPGTLLSEFSIFPTPHIVLSSGSIRYAAIAFAMRPNHISQKNDFSVLPNF